MDWSPPPRPALRPAGFIEPCIPTLAERPPAGPVWMHEIKHDGYSPKVKVSATPNMKTFGGLEDDNTYTVVNVRNVGNQQTTITHVVGFSYRNRWTRLRRKPAGTFIVNHLLPAYPIPYVLGAGQTFMSMILQNEALEKQSREGLLFVGVVHSFANHPVLARVSSIPKEDRQS